jgi:hypothetical protein
MYGLIVFLASGFLITLSLPATTSGKEISGDSTAVFSKIQTKVYQGKD